MGVRKEHCNRLFLTRGWTEPGWSPAVRMSDFPLRIGRTVQCLPCGIPVHSMPRDLAMVQSRSRPYRPSHRPSPRPPLECGACHRPCG
jgi:hypothetical protein